MDVTVIAESTPGPIAINCATYTGYKLAGMKGAVSATVGIVSPSFLLIFILSQFFENILTVGIISHAFKGIRIAVAILIIRAGTKMIKKMIKKSPDKKFQISITIFFFLLTFTLNMINIRISTIYFILCSGLIGFVLLRKNAPKNRNDTEG